MTITRRDLLAGIGSGTAIALPVALKGQRPGPFSAVGAFAGLFGPIDETGHSPGAGEMLLDRTLNATPAWSLDLSGAWRIAKDPENVGKNAGWYGAGPISESVEQIVPNPLELAFPGYDGVVWYWRSFDMAAIKGLDDVQIHFEGADYYAEAWLNGEYLGGNESALLPFAFEARKAIKAGKNNLVVRVIDACYAKEIDGFRLGNVPGGRQHDNPLEGGWRHYNYGGLLLPVTIKAFRRPWIADTFIRPNIHEKKIDIDLSMIGAQDGEWLATVKPKNGAGAATHQTIAIRPDKSGQATISLAITDPHLWDVWDGFLYELELVPRKGGTTWRGTFGMREISILNGRIAINGKPILQRSYLYNQIWPVTLGVPPRDFARRDIELTRKTNANMLRCFSKTPLRVTVEAADEAGILLQHESLGSWYLKNGTKEDERLANITERAVLAYRNNPSILWWNVLNENAPRFDPKRAYPTDEFTLGPYVLDKILPKVHELDPTRPVIANDPIWDDTKCVWEPGHSEPSLPLIQQHYYQFTGLENNEDSWANIRQRKWGVADNPQAAYQAITEWGVNVSPDWSVLMRSYKDSGLREDAEDYKVYRNLHELNRRWYKASGVERQGFPTFESVGEASREHVMWRHQEQMALYWGNLHSVGHGLTSLEDSNYELSGVVDNWRNPKHGVFENITNLNRPLQINLWLRPSALYAGDQLGCDATLVNERQRLAPGTYPVKLKVIDSQNKSVFEKEFSHITGSDPIEHLIADSMTADFGAGVYRLVVELDGAGQHLYAERPVVIFERAQKPFTFNRSVWLWDQDGSLRKWLAARSLSPKDGDASAVQAGDVMLILKTDRLQLPAIHAAIRRGARALILRPETILWSEKPASAGSVQGYSDLLEPVSGGWKPELRKIDWWGSPGAWGYARTALALEDEFLKGLPQGNALEAQPAYQRVAPQYTWVMNDQPQGLQIRHAVREFNLALDMPYTSDLLSLAVGQGTLVLTSLRLAEHLDQDPAADRILENILTELTHGEAYHAGE